MCIFVKVIVKKSVAPILCVHGVYPAVASISTYSVDLPIHVLNYLT